MKKDSNPVPTEDPDDVDRDGGDLEFGNGVYLEKVHSLHDDDDDEEEEEDDQDGNFIKTSSGHNDDDDDDAELVQHAEPLTGDDFSVMSMDTSREYQHHNNSNHHQRRRLHNNNQRQFQDEIFDDDEDEDRMCKSFRSLLGCMSCILVIAILAVLLPGIRNKSEALEVLRTPARIPLEYECHKSTTPSSTDATDDEENRIHSAENYDPEMMQPYEDMANTQPTNMTEFVQSFRESQYDDWGKTYDQVKEGMYHFKSTYYPPYLQDGSTLYESACGIGLNLVMTLEILQETMGIENVFVYGNDLFPASVEKAKTIIDAVAPGHGRRGVFCPSDSQSLSDYVPSNAFDLVYTGYLSPLSDPLHFDIGTDAGFERYHTLCKSNSNNQWAEITLNNIAQQRQNDWFGTWVAEMARIAKPGVPVIVEQVSPPYCDAFFDWGGVQKDFWYQAAANNTYGWDIDPTSIVIEDDIIFRARYHVFMLKNGKRET